MNKLVLANREDIRKIEELERIDFIRSILLSMEIPIENCFPKNEEDEWSTENKIELRKILSKFKIDLVDDFDGGIKIFVDKEAIAEWFKPSFVLKTDLSEPNPKNKLYAEIHLKSWSLFEEQESNGS